MKASQLVSVSSDGQRIVTNSRKVAEVFGKEHKHVIRDIRDLECSIEFTRSNFGPNKIKVLNGSGEETESYDITRDGLVFLVMGYRGAKAAQMKEAYIAAFNEMERQLTQGTNQIDTAEEFDQRLVDNPDLAIKFADAVKLRAVATLTMQKCQQDLKQPAAAVESKDEIQEMLTFILTTVQSKPTRKFINSLQEFYVKYNTLSDRQMECLKSTFKCLQKSPVTVAKQGVGNPQ